MNITTRPSVWLYSTQCGNSHWQALFLDATSNTRAQAAALLLCCLVSISRNMMMRSAALSWYLSSFLYGVLCGYRQNWLFSTGLDQCLLLYINTSASSPSDQSAPLFFPEPHPTCFDPVLNPVERRAEPWHLTCPLSTEWYPVRGCTISPCPVKLVFIITIPVSPVLHPTHRPAVPSSLSSGLTSVSRLFYTTFIHLPSLFLLLYPLLTFRVVVPSR